MSSNLEKLVPLFDGSNYLLWENAMRSYLRSQGVWQIASGIQQQPMMPAAVTPATPENMAARKAAQDDRDDWSNKDDMAMGYITLRVSQSLHHLIANNLSSAVVWETLRTNFGTQGPALIYADFKSALAIKIPVREPALEISKMATIFGRMATSQAIIPDIVQGMLLLAALPREYDSVASTILQNQTRTTLTFVIVRDAVIANAQRRSNVSRPQLNTANKISAVKRKGANPNWQPKQPQGDASGSKQTTPGNNNTDKGKGNFIPSRGKRGGKDKKGKGKRQAHLASVALSASELNNSDSQWYDANFPSLPEADKSVSAITTQLHSASLVPHIADVIATSA